MRGRIFGFALLTLALFLMLSALVVFTGEPPAPSAQADVRAVIAAPPAVQTQADAPQVRVSREKTPAVQAARAPEPPSADANGTPVVRMSYIRANFMAFRLSDRAG